MANKKNWGIAFILIILMTFIALQVPCQINAAIDIETYTDKTAFITRLGGAGAVKVVDFDDIDTASIDPVDFPADRYQSSHGIRITGGDGQFAGKSFGWPTDFIPVSFPNMYAPGSNTTEVLFFSGSDAGLTAGFGLYFIDADWPGSGPSSLTIYNRYGSQIKTSGTVTTLNGQATFIGFVTVDTAINQPIPMIARAFVISGNGWLGNDNNEGVALDDFVFKIPTTSPPSQQFYLPLILRMY